MSQSPLTSSENVRATEGGSAKVFISYSRKDIEFVDRLDTELRQRGIEPLIDRSEIYAFEDWWARIEALIRQADTVVFVLSPEAVASDVCLREVAFADKLNKRIAPVVARAVAPSQVPAALGRLNFVFLDSGRPEAAEFDRLAAALATDIAWVRSHSEYGARAERWRRAGDAADLLLRPPHLEEAEAWLTGRPAGAPLPTEDTAAFVLASRRAVTRRRSLVTAVLALGLILALGLAGLANWQRSEAVAQRAIAERQTALAAAREEEARRERDAAERNFRIAKSTVDDVVFDFARGLRQVDGVRLAVLRSVLSRVDAAIGRLMRAAPDDPALLRSRSAMLDEFGDTYLGAGDGPEAARAYGESLVIMRGLVGREPDNLGWRRDLSVSLARLGNLKLREGDLAGALAAYDEGLAIVRALVRREEGNALWQRDLLIALNKIGDVKLANDDVAGALAAYEEAFAIARALAERDPADAERRRDVSIGLERMGDLRLRQDEVGAALPLFAESLAIRRELAARDPDNALWQRDLSVILDRIGDVRRRTGDPEGALKAEAEGLAITRRLAGRDPGNAGWQRDLAVSLEKAGDTKSRDGDVTSALALLGEAVVIRRELTRRDPASAAWLRDLSIGLEKAGALKLRSGDDAAALALREESLTIRRELVRREPDGTDREGLASSLALVGESRQRTGNRDGARTSYEEEIEVRRELVRRNPSNVEQQALLALRLASSATLEGDPKRRRERLTQSLDILTGLERDGRVPAELRALPDLVRRELNAP